MRSQSLVINSTRMTRIRFRENADCYGFFYSHFMSLRGTKQPHLLNQALQFVSEVASFLAMTLCIKIRDNPFKSVSSACHKKSFKFHIKQNLKPETLNLKTETETENLLPSSNRIQSHITTIIIFYLIRRIE